jgi:hypothetical protein
MPRYEAFEYMKKCKPNKYTLTTKRNGRTFNARWTVQMVRKICPICGCIIRNNKRFRVGWEPELCIHGVGKCLNPLCEEYEKSDKTLPYEDWVLKHFGRKIKTSEYPRLGKLMFFEHSDKEWLERV